MWSRSKFSCTAIIASLMAAAPGCVWFGPHSMTRVWADRNTLNRPAFFVERLSHAPPPRERVERFRWQYGVGPGTPFVTPQAAVMVPPVATDESAAPEPYLPPAAPPPEPTPNAASSTKARTGTAWIFGPSRL